MHQLHSGCKLKTDNKKKGNNEKKHRNFEKQNKTLYPSLSQKLKPFDKSLMFKRFVKKFSKQLLS